MKQRVLGQFIKHGQEFLNESVAETLATTVIPLRDPSNVFFYFRS